MSLSSPSSSTWQPSSTVTRQHLRHLLPVPCLCLLFFLSLSLLTTKDTALCGIDSFWAFRSARRCFFRDHHVHQFPLESKTLFKIFWTHVCITRCQPRVSGCSCLLQNCFQQGFIPQSPRVPEVHREDTQSSSDIHPCLGNSSFVAWDRLNRS